MASGRSKIRVPHETGHAIVGTHDEFKIKYMAIWSAGMGAFRGAPYNPPPPSEK
jgi:hypothetical protein